MGDSPFCTTYGAADRLLDSITPSLSSGLVEGFSCGNYSNFYPACQKTSGSPFFPNDFSSNAPSHIIHQFHLAAGSGADAGVEDGHGLQVEVHLQRGVQRLAGLQVVDKLLG